MAKFHTTPTQELIADLIASGECCPHCGQQYSESRMPSIESRFFDMSVCVVCAGAEDVMSPAVAALLSEDETEFLDVQLGLASDFDEDVAASRYYDQDVVEALADAVRE